MLSSISASCAKQPLERAIAVAALHRRRRLQSRLSGRSRLRIGRIQRRQTMLLLAAGGSAGVAQVAILVLTALTLSAAHRLQLHAQSRRVCFRGFDGGRGRPDHLCRAGSAGHLRRPRVAERSASTSLRHLTSNLEKAPKPPSSITSSAECRQRFCSSASAISTGFRDRPACPKLCSALYMASAHGGFAAALHRAGHDRRGPRLQDCRCPVPSLGA